LRVGLLGMTGKVPRSTRKRRSPSLSYAASPAKLRPGGTALIRAIATRTSPSWPGVTSRAMGRPQESTIAWIFVVRPPRERPIACASAPLFRPPPSGEPWRSCCRWPGHHRGPCASGRRTNDAIVRASSSDGTDCRPWWKDHKRLGNPAIDNPL